MNQDRELRRELGGYSTQLLLSFVQERLAPQEPLLEILRKRNGVPKDEFLSIHRDSKCNVGFKNLGIEPRFIQGDADFAGGFMDMYQVQLVCTRHSVTSETFDSSYLPSVQWREVK